MNIHRNPEELLIELVAEHIADDEFLIEALGGDGSMELEDVERWLARRREETPRFLRRCERLITQMKVEGFGRMMRRPGRRRRGPMRRRF